MRIINFFKDFINYKKLFRYSYNFGFKPYDFKRELALFWETPLMGEGIVNTNNSRYEQLVSIDGFGRSGTGAVCQFLDEFDEVTAMGSITSYENGRTNNEYECLFFMMQGELLSLEEAFLSKRVLYDNQAPLKFSIRVLRNYFNRKYYVPYFDEYYVERSKEFLFDLLDDFSMYHGIYNSLWQYSKPLKDYIPQKKRIDRIYPNQELMLASLWKDMSLGEFRAKGKAYMNDILNHIPSKKFLAFIALFSGYEQYNEKLFSDYFGNIKSIYVWRDPRDQYARCNELDARVVAPNPKYYVKFFKKITKNIFNAKSPNLLVVRFEEFVTDYERVKEQIVNFLGIDPNTHVKKFQYFDPKRSIEKIGAYKNHKDQDAIAYIERELKEYCWNN